MKQYLSYFALTLLLLSQALFANEVESFNKSVEMFNALTSERMDRVKEGSKPFILSQNKKAPTVVMLHGLSDSPGSLKEVSQIYYKRGYNVVTVLLRDHGLLAPYRHDIRASVTLKDWREDIDQLMTIAFTMSDTDKVALIGFSMGGALALDVSSRYEGKISSLVLLAPLLKMNHSWAAPATRLIRHVRYSLEKGIPEAEHFYPDIAYNQTFQGYTLTKHLKDNVTKKPKASLIKIPKMLFLTDADTTIENDYALEVASRLQIDQDRIVLYANPEKNSTTLHRDLPMRKINATGEVNPHIEDLLNQLDGFLASLE